MYTPYLVYIFLFIFGIIIGSFLNVVILRFDTGRPIVKGRSKCFSCGKTLHWYELVPVLSFIFQGGKCRECESKISIQYPLVELAGGFSMIIAYMSASLLPTVSASVLFFALLAVLLFIYIVIFVYDLRHSIIPDAFSYSAALIALAMLAVKSYAWGIVDLYTVNAGPALFLFFFAFWYFSKGRWMGLGDGKLALSVGWVLGLGGGIAALLFSFWIGTIFALLVIVLQKIRFFEKVCGMDREKKLGMKSEIPFGPFIIIGFVLVLMFPNLFAYIMTLLAL